MFKSILPKISLFKSQENQDTKPLVDVRPTQEINKNHIQSAEELREEQLKNQKVSCREGMWG